MNFNSTFLPFVWWRKKKQQHETNKKVYNILMLVLLCIYIDKYVHMNIRNHMNNIHIYSVIWAPANIIITLVIKNFSNYQVACSIHWKKLFKILNRFWTLTYDRRFFGSNKISCFETVGAVLVRNQIGSKWPYSFVWTI